MERLDYPPFGYILLSSADQMSNSVGSSHHLKCKNINKTPMCCTAKQFILCYKLTLKAVNFRVHTLCASVKPLQESVMFESITQYKQSISISQDFKWPFARIP